MRIIVFGLTIKQAYEKLDALLKTIPSTPRSIHRCNTSYHVAFSTVTYKALTPSDNSKGQKCDKAYIPKDISPEMYNKIIRSFMTMSQLPHTETVVHY